MTNDRLAIKEYVFAQMQPLPKLLKNYMT